jgi:hypothetical protein
MMINPNEAVADVTATFLIDGKPAVSRTMATDGAGRSTLDISEIAELRERTFAIVLRSTQPILAERAMYWPDGASGWRDGHTGTPFAGGANTRGIRLP